MKLSSKTGSIYKKIHPNTKLGDLRLIAKEIKKDHASAMELWSTGEFLPRQLAILIMDAKLLTSELVDSLERDIQTHPKEEKLQLIDWLMANQLTKDKRTISMMQSWQNHTSPLFRRIFWYYQGRLRWMGQQPPSNTETLILSVEKNIMKEEPEVQWAMNFTAGQIGIYQPEFRSRCMAIGEETGLYKNEIVAKNCTPNYLPKFIEIQVAKIKKA